MSQNDLCQHLVRDIPNTDKNRKFVKDINKQAKKSNSMWKLKIRYRKPKEGHRYGYGGNLRRENANAFSVYIEDRRPYDQIPSNVYRSELWKENRELKEELAFYKNPYSEWREDEIEEELQKLYGEIIAIFLKHSNCELLKKEDAFRNKYKQLSEALAYHRKMREESTCIES